MGARGSQGEPGSQGSQGSQERRELAEGQGEPGGPRRSPGAKSQEERRQCPRNTSPRRGHPRQCLRNASTGQGPHASGTPRP